MNERTGLAEKVAGRSPRTVDDLLSDLREVCTCVGENKAQEGDDLCLFCDSRLQIEAQQRTIQLLTKRPSAQGTTGTEPTLRDAAHKAVTDFVNSRKCQTDADVCVALSALGTMAASALDLVLHGKREKLS